uniref:hypothetical protein n=1 Tax=Candidatus Fimivicinus sp. TaxID=3056640 RepID=UPI003FEDEDCE
MGYFCMNVQSALHAEPDKGALLNKELLAENVQSALHAEPDLIVVFLTLTDGNNVQSALHAEPDSKNSQSLVCLYSFITAYFTGFCKHPTHTKRL